MTPCAEHRDRLRVLMMVAVACAHLSLALLRTVHRVVITVPVTNDTLSAVVRSDLWYLLQFGCAAMILAAIVWNRGHLQVMAASTGVMSAWAFLNFLWGFDAVRPVSLAGPAMGMIVAVFSYLLTMSWAMQGGERDHRE